MDIPIHHKQIIVTPWVTKFVECFFAGVIAANGVLMFLPLVPEAVRMKLRLLISILFGGQLLLGVVAGFGISGFWHKAERKGRINSMMVHAWLRGMLRFWLAFEISTYGFAKILKTQFAESFLRDDTPVRQLNGFELTWHYFSHSYALAVIIACLQIGGSILLMFRRTTLLGVVILLPVLVNIFLIDLFYHIPAGAFLNSILFTLGLLYLLFLRWPELVKVFLPSASDLPAVRLGVFKILLRVLAIGLAFGIVFGLVKMNPVSPMAGKWMIDRLVRNRDTVKAMAWQTDSTAWTTLYIEERGALAFCPNPYVYQPERSDRFQYIYDSVRHQMSLILLANRKDSAFFHVTHDDGRGMEWDGVFNDDTLSLKLRKVAKGSQSPQ